VYDPSVATLPTDDGYLLESLLSAIARLNWDCSFGCRSLPHRTGGRSDKKEINVEKVDKKKIEMNKSKKWKLKIN